MAVLPITKLGHPILRATAVTVPESEIPTPDFQRLIDDMIETVRAAPGVGLAAPQVGVGKRLCLIENRGDGEECFDLEVMINPILHVREEAEEEGWEGCLSIDGLRGLVPRKRAVEAVFIDRQGTKRTIEASGFQSRVVQHEVDHLHGILFLDRMRDLKTLAQTEEWERYWIGQEESHG